LFQHRENLLIDAALSYEKHKNVYKNICVKTPFRIKTMGLGAVKWARADINFVVTQ